MIDQLYSGDRYRKYQQLYLNTVSKNKKLKVELKNLKAEINNLKAELELSKNIEEVKPISNRKKPVKKPVQNQKTTIQKQQNPTKELSLKEEITDANPRNTG